MAVVYVASIDIERVQRYVLETDKLREMLGASRRVDLEATGGEALGEAVKVLWPVSGTVVYYSSDRTALLEHLWKRKCLLEADGIAHLMGYLKEVPLEWLEVSDATSPLQRRVLGPLADQCRSEKGQHREADARPQLALFAPCLLHGLEPANHFYAPQARGTPRARIAAQEVRRSLVGFRAEAKLMQWERSKVKERRRLATALAADFLERHGLMSSQLTQLEQCILPAVKFDDLLAPDHPLEDEPSTPKSLDPKESGERREKSFVALIKADGDGLGTLVHGINWNAPHWSGASIALTPAQRAAKFAGALDAATRSSVDEATAEVTWNLMASERRERLFALLREGKPLTPQDGIKVPVLPLLFGGDDLWLLCRREVALEFARSASRRFSERMASDGICRDAAASLKGSDRFTLSLGVVFAKVGFPFDPLFDLAGELLKSAKTRRKQRLERGEPEGCIDLHWLASSARETLLEARATGYTYQDADRKVELTTRPWTLSELSSLCNTARALDHHLQDGRLPHRKLEQLEDLLRRGATLAEFAWRLWRARLSKEERERLDELLNSLPDALKLPHPDLSPFCEEAASKRTPLLDLLELREILRSPQED